MKAKLTDDNYVVVEANGEKQSFPYSEWKVGFLKPYIEQMEKAERELNKARQTVEKLERQVEFQVKQHKLSIRAELNEIDYLLEEIPEEDTIDRQSLLDRKEAVLEELRELERPPLGEPVTRNEALRIAKEIAERAKAERYGDSDDESGKPNSKIFNCCDVSEEYNCFGYQAGTPFVSHRGEMSPFLKRLKETIDKATREQRAKYYNKLAAEMIEAVKISKDGRWLFVYYKNDDPDKFHLDNWEQEMLKPISLRLESECDDINETLARMNRIKQLLKTLGYEPTAQKTEEDNNGEEA